jgi:hypothetical protein
MCTSIVKLKLFILFETENRCVTYLCWILSVEVTSRNGQLPFSEYHLRSWYTHMYNIHNNTTVEFVLKLVLCTYGH